eukprot:3623288-Amphidinium_carterae.1
MGRRVVCFVLECNYSVAAVLLVRCNVEKSADSSQPAVFRACVAGRCELECGGGASFGNGSSL